MHIRQSSEEQLGKGSTNGYQNNNGFIKGSTSRMQVSELNIRLQFVSKIPVQKTM